MSQEYIEDKEVTLTKLSSGRRLLEALLILIVLFAVWLMAALLSFNPSDPSWSQTAWHEPPLKGPARVIWYSIQTNNMRGEERTRNFS